MTRPSPWACNAIEAMALCRAPGRGSAAGDNELQGFERTAYNLKLTDIQAAIGLVQMTRLQDFIREHRRIAAAYREQIEGLAGIGLPTCVSEECDVNQAFVCRWAPLPPEDLLNDGTGLSEGGCLL